MAILFQTCGRPMRQCGKRELGKEVSETGIRGRTWRMVETTTKCATSDMIPDGEISKYLDSRRVPVV